MKKVYEHYGKVTRENLDSVKVGDLIKINNWKKPMKVKAVSKNYFVMTQKNFGQVYYSVVSKIPWEGTVYNDMRGGMFYCGADNTLFGGIAQFNYPDLYKFENKEANAVYLDELENEEIKVSERRGMAIYDLFIWRAENESKT